MSKKKNERNSELLKKKEEGWSIRKIADHYNLHPSTVHEIVKREMSQCLELSTV